MTTLVLEVEATEDTALTGGEGIYAKIDLTEKLAKSVRRRVRLLTGQAADGCNVAALLCNDLGRLTVFRQYPDMESIPDDDGTLTMQEALCQVGNSVTGDLSLPRNATDGLIAVQSRMMVYLAPGGPRVKWRFSTSNGIELFTNSISAAAIDDITTRSIPPRDNDDGPNHGPAFEYTVPWGDVQMLKTGANTVDATLKDYALEIARRTEYRTWRNLVASDWWGVVSIDPQSGYRVRLYVGDTNG